MAKKATTKSPSSPLNSAVDEQKQRKQQAKREAKLMLAIEKTKTDIQKTEKKRAKTQALLEANKAHLRTLETGLSEIRASHEETKASTPDTDFDHQSRQPEPEVITINSNQKNPASTH